AVLCTDEIPPPLRFVLVIAPLTARRHDLPDLRGEESQVVVCQIEIAVEKTADIVERRAYVSQRSRRTGDQIDRLASEPVQLTSSRVDEVVCNGSSGPVRDPAHRVGDVSIEAWEKPESVFAGEVLATVLARVGN